MTEKEKIELYATNPDFISTWLYLESLPDEELNLKRVVLYAFIEGYEACLRYIEIKGKCRPYIYNKGD